MTLCRVRRCRHRHQGLIVAQTMAVFDPSLRQHVAGASMTMDEDAMVSTADNGWRELIGLKKATLNRCKGFVVERDASTGRYLFQVVAPSDAADEAQQCGPWARFMVKAANIQVCSPAWPRARAKALATPAARQGQGAAASSRDDHGPAASSHGAAALHDITTLQMVSEENTEELEARLVSNMEDVGKKVDFRLDTWVDLPGMPGPMIKFTVNRDAPPHCLYKFLAERQLQMHFWGGIHSPEVMVLTRTDIIMWCPVGCCWPYCWACKCFHLPMRGQGSHNESVKHMKMLGWTRGEDGEQVRQMYKWKKEKREPLKLG